MINVHVSGVCFYAVHVHGICNAHVHVCMCTSRVTHICISLSVLSVPVPMHQLSLITTNPIALKPARVIHLSLNKLSYSTYEISIFLDDVVV